MKGNAQNEVQVAVEVEEETRLEMHKRVPFTFTGSHAQLLPASHQTEFEARSFYPRKDEISSSNFMYGSLRLIPRGLGDLFKASSTMELELLSLVKLLGLYGGSWISDTHHKA
ncbi:uncharacterized protein RSE6_12270 [Rhynchosporium secalis]|uniref:Uncharacterized protein n=1 Tax=Rhynchosporium secalis TaxID=38038 RepID=A0A1E1MQX4_RHYSE|nr:uncharacterized protein RSE6_12270 [Rhynchosporium secalis]